MKGVQMPTESGKRSGHGMRVLVTVFVLFLLVLIAALAGFKPMARSLGWLTANPAGTPSLNQMVPGSQLFSDSGERGSAPDPTALSQRLAQVGKPIGSTAGMLILDSSGQELYADGADQALVPASNMKILTTAAALSVLPPDTTFQTRTVLAATDLVVLIGGGDPSLTAEPGSGPSTRELAKETAAALTEQGLTSVSVAYDDSLFVGPSWHPSWPADDIGYVGPVTALTLDAGYLSSTRTFSTTPSEDALRVFASQLSEFGVTVTSALGFSQAPDDAVALASVRSGSLLSLASVAMEHSLNVQTEILLRHLASASGEEPSFAGGVKSLSTALQNMGLDVSQSNFSDGSGMSYQNRVTPRLLANAVFISVTDPVLSRLIPGMPVAGATGTLEERFYAPGSEAAKGFVTAKTGTLNGVAALSGVTQTVDGAVVIFSMEVNDGFGDLRAYLDRSAAAITSCGCG